MQMIERKAVLMDFEEYEDLKRQLEAYQFLNEFFEQVEDELLVELAEEREKSNHSTISLSEMKRKYNISNTQSRETKRNNQ